MTKDEYKTLIQEYKNNYDVPYITAIQYICCDKKKIEKDFDIAYSTAILNTYNDTIKSFIYLGLSL